MSKINYTPGPWDYDWCDGHVSFYSSAHTDDYFMRVNFSGGVDSREWDPNEPPTEEIANARLIAAVPELYETNQIALYYIEQLIMQFPKLKDQGPFLPPLHGPVSAENIVEILKTANTKAKFG